ncbi:hypothetical protein FRC03_004432 [Tulasnella sp. 419]|nr:hypothetical protein FRC03_004432 [Tulasnella sp. 419]
MAAYEFLLIDYSDPYGNSPQVSPIPATSKTPFLSKLWNGDHAKYPLEQKIEAKRRGNLYRQRRPWVTYTLTAAMFAVMIYEFVANWKAQGTPFSFKPVVNPLLGPSQSVLIEVGARFAPCMKHVEDAPPTFMLGCANNTANPATSICTIEDLCEFGGFHGKEPNQWFRFITPIFLHAGLVHIFLNMFVQWTLAGQVEREMGSIPFTLLYFAAGIFGNILGGNFAMVGLPSVGASGAIFGTVGTLWVDLIAHWQYEYRPVKKLILLIIELVIGVALGYVPGVDNFAHLGGFLLGVLSAVVLYPILSTTKRHATIVWIARAIALVLSIILYVVLTRNFYTGDPYKACSWCRYLSCIPSSLNQQCKG